MSILSFFTYIYIFFFCIYFTYIFYCCLSLSHPQQVFSNVIDLGTTKMVSYLPWPRHCLGVALCIQLCGTRLFHFSLLCYGLYLPVIASHVRATAFILAKVRQRWLESLTITISHWEIF